MVAEHFDLMPATGRKRCKKCYSAWFQWRLDALLEQEPEGARTVAQLRAVVHAEEPPSHGDHAVKTFAAGGTQNMRTHLADHENYYHWNPGQVLFEH